MYSLLAHILTYIIQNNGYEPFFLEAKLFYESACPSFTHGITFLFGYMIKNEGYKTLYMCVQKCCYAKYVFVSVFIIVCLIIYIKICPYPYLLITSLLWTVCL